MKRGVADGAEPWRVAKICASNEVAVMDEGREIRCWKREYLLRKAEGFKAGKICSIDPRYLMREADLSQ